MKSLNEIKSFFSDAYGDAAVLKSPDSDRPYILVGWKKVEDEQALLYANFDLGPACGHKKGPAGETLHTPAIGIVARFFQVGGTPETFTGHPLKVRAFGKHEGKDVVRLSKHTFPLCPMFGAQVEQSWVAQEVTPQLVDWLKGVITATGATPAKDAYLREVIDLAKGSIPEAGSDGFFSLEAMDHKDAGDPSADLPQQVKEKIGEQLSEALAKILTKKGGSGGGMLN